MLVGLAGGKVSGDRVRESSEVLFGGFRYVGGAYVKLEK